MSYGGQSVVMEGGGKRLVGRVRSFAVVGKRLVMILE